MKRSTRPETSGARQRPAANGAFGLFQREQRSLFGEILDWMLTPLLLLWPLSLALTWFVAQGISSKPFDRALEFNLQALTQFIVVNEHGTPQFNLTSQARDLLRADDTDQVFYQVRNFSGQVVSGDPEFPPPPTETDPTYHIDPTIPPEAIPLQAGRIQLRDDVVRNEKVRVAYTWVARPHNGYHELVLLQVGETRGKRAQLATEIIKGVMVPQFVTLPLAVLLVWLALVRGIRPLHELEQRIRARKPDDLSPIDDHGIPQEVTPLVASINDLLQRLTVSLGTQKRFLADAAHQLKTPLAGLRMQAEMAQQATNPDDVQRSLQQIAKSSVRATHTVNQLLALARAETTGRTLPTSPIDLPALVMEVVEDAVPRALDKRIDLGYEGPPRLPDGCSMEGNPTLLSELVRNLVDNALNYTPAGGIVTARVVLDVAQGVQELQVEDNGPGIPEHERPLVLEPFYRALGTNVDGSGLGLAIVQEIALQHGATLTLDDTHPNPGGSGGAGGAGGQRGLKVTVRLPLHNSSVCAEQLS